MLVTLRDQTIIQWTNSHHFATALQIARYFQMGQSVCYRRLRKMVQNGYLYHERIFHGKPGVYRVTSSGQNIAGDVLTPKKITNANLATYGHGLTVIDVATALEAHTGGTWKTERHIRREKGITGVGRTEHVPDGELKFSDGKSIAVEVELSGKSQRRLQKILRQYARTEYKEVWYICGTKAITERIRTAAGKARYIKIHLLEEVLENGNKGQAVAEKS